MKNLIQKGDVVTFTATVDVVSGQGLLLGSLFGIVTGDVASEAEGELALTGVYTLPKTEAQAWTVGALIYWNNTDSVCTTTATGNTKVGHALAAAANPSTSGAVRLSGAA